MNSRVREEVGMSWKAYTPWAVPVVVAGGILAGGLSLGQGPDAGAPTPATEARGGLGADLDALRTHDPEDFSALITADDLYNRIYFLASDALKGRDTPSPGLEAAAAYLVSEHRRMGLEPAGEDDTFYQRFPFQRRGLNVDGVELQVGDAALTYEEDFFVMGGAEEPLDGPLVFVSGDGNPGSDGALEGAVALFALESGPGPELLQEASAKAGLAEREGARAALHILDPGFPAQSIRQAAVGMAQPQWTVGEQPPFPQIFMTRDAAERLLEDGPANVEELLTRASEGAAVRETLEGLDVSGAVPVNTLESAYPPNVLAKLPGSDPELRDEYIILSAHFDHVGVGQPMNGDSIYNGADDNASGTAALLEVARALRSLPEAPRRTVVFAHVSAEERGLLGSEWFVDNPTIPIENAVANINADMVGSDTHADSVFIIGKEYSTLGELVDDVNSGRPELNLTASEDIWPEERLFFRSDQFHFMRKEIPSLFFFTGLHDCYHQPCDTPDFVDPDKAARIARLIAHSVVEIANRDERPEWYPEGIEEVRRMTAGGR